MSAALLVGGLPDTINSSGNTVISSGLGIGPYLFIVAPAIKIIAGVVLRQIKVPETEKIKTVENQKNLVSLLANHYGNVAFASYMQGFFDFVEVFNYCSSFFCDGVSNFCLVSSLNCNLFLD